MDAVSTAPSHCGKGTFARRVRRLAALGLALQLLFLALPAFKESTSTRPDDAFFTWGCPLSQECSFSRSSFFLPWHAGHAAASLVLLALGPVAAWPALVIGLLVILGAFDPVAVATMLIAFGSMDRVRASLPWLPWVLLPVCLLLVLGAYFLASLAWIRHADGWVWARIAGGITGLGTALIPLLLGSGWPRLRKALPWALFALAGVLLLLAQLGFEDARGDGEEWVLSKRMSSLVLGGLWLHVGLGGVLGWYTGKGQDLREASVPRGGWSPHRLILGMAGGCLILVDALPVAWIGQVLMPWHLAFEEGAWAVHWLPTLSGWSLVFLAVSPLSEAWRGRLVSACGLAGLACIGWIADTLGPFWAVAPSPGLVAFGLLGMAGIILSAYAALRRSGMEARNWISRILSLVGLSLVGAAFCIPRSWLEGQSALVALVTEVKTVGLTAPATELLAWLPLALAGCLAVLAWWPGRAPAWTRMIAWMALAYLPAVPLCHAAVACWTVRSVDPMAAAMSLAIVLSALLLASTGWIRARAA